MTRRVSAQTVAAVDAAVRLAEASSVSPETALSMLLQVEESFRRPSLVDRAWTLLESVWGGFKRGLQP